MNKQKANEFFKKFTQNKVYQFLTSLFISLVIAYTSWYYVIQNIHIKRVSLEKRIEKVDEKKLKQEIKKLKIVKTKLIESYNKEQNNFKKLEKEIYQTHYPIVTDILNKINAYSFNIHSYNLDNNMNRIDVEIEGSYQNLIRFIDFLGNIPATVDVKEYTIKLSQENMMVIKLGIEVKPIRI